MTMKICPNLIAFVVVYLAISLSSKLSAEIRRGVLTLTLIRFVHFFAFGSWLGTQFWTTFIAGVTMYYNMSRHAFGDLQGKLFPKYFLCGSVLSVSALASYCLMNPVELWQTKGSELYQVSGLVMALSSCLLNYMYLEPKTHTLMNERYSYERERGSGDEIGPVQDESLRKDEKYVAITRRFACVHGFSSMVNVAGFSGCLLHLWYLAATLKVA